MGGKNSAPPPPDYSEVAAASKEAAELSYKLGKEQLEWAKETYANDKQVTDRIVESFLQSMDANTEAAQKDRERYEQIFQPLEDDLAREAQDYSSPERKDLEIGRAQARVGQQFEAARQNAQRELESFGINPGATRYAALDIGVRAQEAAAKAAAGNQASQMVDATGRALRSEAINVGRGYPGQIAGTYNTALQAGTGSVNSNLATTASGANTMGTPTQWMGLGNQAVGQWGNTLHMGYQDQMAQYQANQQASSGWGSALGLIGGAALGFMGLPTSSIGGKLLGFNDGGAVPEDATTGGAVPTGASPTGGRALDDVPARLTAGEFVIPKDTVQWFGEKHFQQLIEKARKEKGGAGAKPAPASALPGAPTFQSRPAAALPLG